MSSLKKLTLGIPNGSLLASTLELLKKVGVTIIQNGRSFEGKVDGIGIFDKVFFMRPQDIPMAISRGTIDCGICGWDCVVESSLESELVKITELNYSKKSRKPVQVVVFSKRFSKLEDSEGITVTTEYPNMTKKIFRNAPQENIDFSHGTTEAKVISGMYDFGVCVTETGESIRDNNLNIVKTLLVSPTVFMAKAMIPELEGFGKMLLGALYAKKFQLITMNADVEAKERIISMLPSLKSPTISHLGNGEFSIASVVKLEGLGDLLLELKMLGATGIYGTDINYIIE